MSTNLSSNPPLTSPAESHVDKVCSCLEVDTHVKAAGIVSPYSHVGDLHALVDVWLYAAFAVSCIEDMSDSMLG